MNKIIGERLENYEIIPWSGCWIWMGALDQDGYGLAKYSPEHRVIRVHRISYKIHIGPIPEGMEVCHTCDIRCCINPYHLYAGTHQNNMDDMARRGRADNWGRNKQERELAEKYPELYKNYTDYFKDK